MSDLQAICDEGDELYMSFLDPADWFRANWMTIAAALRERELRLNPTDSEEPITEEWLRSIGFVRGRFESDLVMPPIVRGLNVRDELVNEYWVVRTYPIPEESKPTTRGQLRRLMSALGIKEQTNGN